MSSTETEKTENTENTETTENTGSKENEWGIFGMKVLQIFIHILIVGLLGANFVYFTRINLDLFFPSEPTQRPYVNETKKGIKLPAIFSFLTSGKESSKKAPEKKNTGGGSCGAPIDFTESKLFENKYFSGMFKYGFPYSMESKEDTFGGIISNWFVNKVKYSYVWLRQVIKVIIEFTGSTCAMAPDSMKSIVPFIFGPMAMMLIIFIASMWWIPTLVSVFWNENQDWGMWISIAGLFFGWTWFLPIVLSFIRMIGVMFSFILLPPMLNGKKIMEIMGEKFNSYYLTVLFLILVIVAAFTNLNPIIAIVMALVFAKHLIPPGMNPFEKKAAAQTTTISQK